MTDQQLLAKHDLRTLNSGLFEHYKEVHTGFSQRQSCSRVPALITNGHLCHSFNLFIRHGCCFRSDFFAISSSFCFTVINLHHLSHTDVRVRWHDEVSVVYFYLYNEESSQRVCMPFRHLHPAATGPYGWEVGDPMPYWTLRQRLDKFTGLLTLTPNNAMGPEQGNNISHE